MVVHLIVASKRGVKRVSVGPANTDVVVILTYHFISFKFEAFWVKMGVGQHRP